MRLRSRWFLVMASALIGTLAAGCGDDDSKTDDGDAACLAIDGSWNISNHCQTSVVGTTATVHQSGCSISAVDPWTGWSGSMTPGDGITMSGPAGTAQMTCTGTVTASAITMSCNPTCDVELTR